MHTNEIYRERHSTIQVYVMKMADAVKTNLVDDTDVESYNTKSCRNLHDNNTVQMTYSNHPSLINIISDECAGWRVLDTVICEADISSFLKIKFVRYV